MRYCTQNGAATTDPQADRTAPAGWHSEQRHRPAPRRKKTSDSRRDAPTAAKSRDSNQLQAIAEQKRQTTARTSTRNSAQLTRAQPRPAEHDDQQQPTELSTGLPQATAETGRPATGTLPPPTDNNARESRKTAGTRHRAPPTDSRELLHRQPIREKHRPSKQHRSTRREQQQSIADPKRHQRQSHAEQKAVPVVQTNNHRRPENNSKKQHRTAEASCQSSARENRQPQAVPHRGGEGPPAPQTTHQPPQLPRPAGPRLSHSGHPTFPSITNASPEPPPKQNPPIKPARKHRAKPTRPSTHLTRSNRRTNLTPTPTPGGETLHVMDHP